MLKEDTNLGTQLIETTYWSRLKRDGKLTSTAQKPSPYC